MRPSNVADFIAIAQAVTGLDLQTVMNVTNIDLADSALHAPAAGFGDDDFTRRRGDQWLGVGSEAIETVRRNDPIIIDKIGFAPLDHTGCRLLFRLVAAADERRSIAIGSHSPFEQWGRSLPDQPTAVSLLDQLCHHAQIITTTGDSYRLTHRTTRMEA